MSDIIDINVNKIVEVVEITTTENVTTVNVNTNTGVDAYTKEESNDLFIPLSGTEVGKPITGDIEFLNAGFLGVDSANEVPALFDIDKTTLVSARGFYTTGLSFEWDSNGWRSNINHSPNITDLDYTQKIYVDNELSTKLDFKTKATYALMVADNIPTIATIYNVTNDENKNYNRSTYLWKPDGNREWIATTPDN